MQAVTIDWDRVELLPKWCCSVCAQIAVPWGRTLDNEFLCSKACHDIRLKPQQRSSLPVRHRRTRPASGTRRAGSILQHSDGVSDQGAPQGATLVIGRTDSCTMRG
ncbi:MAG: hypothetical protein ABI854_11400 [Betaproteobacteria bacterium]